MRREPLAAHTRAKAPFPVSLLFNVKLFYWIALVIMLVASPRAPSSGTTTRTAATQQPSTATPTAGGGDGDASRGRAAPGEDLRRRAADEHRHRQEVLRRHQDRQGGHYRLELFAGEAPQAVNNFVFLARDGFYDGLTFFRVVPASWPRPATPPAPTDPAVTCTGRAAPATPCPQRRTTRSMRRFGRHGRGQEAHVPTAASSS